MSAPCVMFDFDGTYTADVKLMREIVALFIRAGWRVVVITARSGTDDDVTLLRQLVQQSFPDVPVLFAGEQPKRKVAQAHGISVDIWIEDNPVLVDFGVAGLELVRQLHGVEPH